jgi:hypothetical protein
MVVEAAGLNIYQVAQQPCWILIGQPLDQDPLLR